MKIQFGEKPSLFADYEWSRYQAETEALIMNWAKATRLTILEAKNLTIDANRYFSTTEVDFVVECEGQRFDYHLYFTWCEYEMPTKDFFLIGPSS